MSQADYIAQPTSRTTLDALQAILQNNEVEQLDVAVAYVTASGAYDLLKRVSELWAMLGLVFRKDGSHPSIIVAPSQ